MTDHFCGTLLIGLFTVTAGQLLSTRTTSSAAASTTLAASGLSFSKGAVLQRGRQPAVASVVEAGVPAAAAIAALSRATAVASSVALYEALPYVYAASAQVTSPEQRGGGLLLPE